jgi:hypothetical protein
MSNVNLNLDLIDYSISTNPQNSEIAQAVVDGRVQPSTLPRCPWCQGHGDMLGRGRLSTIAHDMNWQGSTPSGLASKSMEFCVQMAVPA